MGEMGNEINLGCINLYMLSVPYQEMLKSIDFKQLSSMSDQDLQIPCLIVCGFIPQ